MPAGPRPRAWPGALPRGEQEKRRRSGGVAFGEAPSVQTLPPPGLPVSRLYLHLHSQCPDSTSTSTPSVQTLPPPALPVSRLYLHQHSQCPDSTSTCTPSVQTLPPPALPVSRLYLHLHSQCPDSTSTKQNLTGSGSNIHFLFTTNLG
ncbi:unnamed protein product [Boreogadus saida]